jgi:hypothetical protein
MLSGKWITRAVLLVVVLHGPTVAVGQPTRRPVVTKVEVKQNKYVLIGKGFGSSAAAIQVYEGGTRVPSCFLLPPRALALGRRSS